MSDIEDRIVFTQEIRRAIVGAKEEVDRAVCRWKAEANRKIADGICGKGGELERLIKENRFLRERALVTDTYKFSSALRGAAVALIAEVMVFYMLSRGGMMSTDAALALEIIHGVLGACVVAISVLVEPILRARSKEDKQDEQNGCAGQHV